jgi:hypothetical protein
MLSGVCRFFANHRSSFPSEAYQKQGAFPPSRFRDFSGTTPLSDSRPEQHHLYCCGSLPRIRVGSPTLHTILSRRAILNTPVDQNRCFCRLLPCPASAFPVYRVGRLPRLYFRGLLKVHSRYGPSVCSPPIVDFCPRSFSRKVSLSVCPGSYRVVPTITRTELPSVSTVYPRGAPRYCGRKFSEKVQLMYQQR